MKAGGNVSSAPSWKVLVYDSIGQSILAPLFSVKELREMGVTLHILLHSERQEFFFFHFPENLTALK